MKKILLTVALVLSIIFSGAQPSQSSKNVLGDNIVPIIYHGDTELLSIFNYDKLTTIKTEKCDVNVYSRTYDGNVNFLIKTTGPIKYEFILYDTFGRIWINKEIKHDTKMSLCLPRGIYLIRLLDDKETCVKKIDI